MVRDTGCSQGDSASSGRGDYGSERSGYLQVHFLVNILTVITHYDTVRAFANIGYSTKLEVSGRDISAVYTTDKMG